MVEISNIPKFRLLQSFNSVKVCDNLWECVSMCVCVCKFGWVHVCMCMCMSLV